MKLVVTVREAVVGTLLAYPPRVAVVGTSLAYPPREAANFSIIRVCNHAPLRLPKLQDCKLLTLIFKMGQGACRFCFCL